MVQVRCIRLVDRSVDWIKQAKRDLQCSQFLLKGGFYEWASFIAQQAAEKALRAVFDKIGKRITSHSVFGLLLKLPQDLKPDSRLVEIGKELDKSFVRSRDPRLHKSGAPYENFEEEDAVKAIECAKEIIDFVEGIILETTHSFD